MRNAASAFNYNPGVSSPGVHIPILPGGGVRPLDFSGLQDIGEDIGEIFAARRDRKDMQTIGKLLGSAGDTSSGQRFTAQSLLDMGTKQSLSAGLQLLQRADETRNRETYANAFRGVDFSQPGSFREAGGRLLATGNPDHISQGMRFLDRADARDERRERRSDRARSRADAERKRAATEARAEATREATRAALVKLNLDPSYADIPGIAEKVIGERLKAPKEPKVTDTQAKAAGFARRMRSANEIIAQPEITDAAMSVTGQLLDQASDVPGIGIAANYLKSPNFQKYSQAQRNFINAALRRESGAAIADHEFANARQQYFPQPGDSPEVLAQKARNRAEAILGVEGAAGPLGRSNGRQPSNNGVPSRADIIRELKRRGAM